MSSHSLLIEFGCEELPSSSLKQLGVAMGEITAATPSTRPILARFEPVMLPKARAVCPSRAPRILITNSGELVPKATTVKPTTSGGTP